MSFVGVKDIRHIAPKLLSTEIAGHQLREDMIRQSALDWTIVRSVTLTNGKHTGQFRTGEDITLGGFTSTISRADVADCILRQLADDKSKRKIIRVMH